MSRAMELDIPKLGQVEAVLRSSVRVSRGQVAPRELRGRLSLGEPLAVAITPEFAADDPDLPGLRASRGPCRRLLARAPRVHIQARRGLSL